MFVVLIPFFAFFVQSQQVVNSYPDQRTISSSSSAKLFCGRVAVGIQGIEQVECHYPCPQVWSANFTCPNQGDQCIPSTLAFCNITSFDFVAQAEQFLSDLSPSSSNVYGLGDVMNFVDPVSANTECASFTTRLLEYTFSWVTPSGPISKLFGANKPGASIYHTIISTQAIAAFSLINDATTIKRGDILAAKYPLGSAVTGHVLVMKEDIIYDDYQAGAYLNGTDQYIANVLDSTNALHGSTDSRLTQTLSAKGGVGSAFIRIYVNQNDNSITGWAWSSDPVSSYYDQNIRNMVVGRINIPWLQNNGYFSYQNTNTLPQNTLILIISAIGAAILLLCVGLAYSRRHDLLDMEKDFAKTENVIEVVNAKREEPKVTTPKV